MENNGVTRNMGMKDVCLQTRPMSTIAKNIRHVLDIRLHLISIEVLDYKI